MNTISKEEAALAAFFNQGGCSREPDSKRRQQEKSAYKKGYELRFSVKDEAELAVLLDLLNKNGFKAGKPYKKHPRIIIPVYGESAHRRMQEILLKIAEQGTA